MHTLMKLRDILMDELERQTAKGSLTEQSLDVVDKITHSIKCIDTIAAMESSSGESRDGYSGRRYRDGYSGDEYSGENSGRRSGYFYTQRDDGRSGLRRRDSMGRYADSYSGRRGYSRDEAKDKLISEMEGMMGGVSPDAQMAIEKAIRALNQE